MIHPECSAKVLIAAVLLLAGCASQPVINSSVNENSGLTSHETEVTWLGNMKQPESPVEPFHSRIIVKRTYSILGSGGILRLKDNGKVAGFVGPGGTAWWDRAPGKIKLTSDGMMGVEPTEFIAEPNTTNYVTAEIGFRRHWKLVYSRTP